MLKNYFIIAWRNLIKGKVYSLINIGGLAIGLACCLTIGLFILDEYSYDKFHTHSDRIYRVVEKNMQAGVAYDVAVTPGPLAAALKTDFPEVLQTCRVNKPRSGILQNNKTTTEPSNLLVVDNSFFSLFDFKLLKGNPQTALLQPNEIVISENMAEHFFGKEWQHSKNLIGQSFTFNKDRPLILAGVIQNAPTNSHIQFDVLLSTRYDELNSKKINWGNNDYHTYIRLDTKANTSLIGSKLLIYLTKFTPKTKHTLSLQPLTDIYLHSDFAFETDWSKTSNYIYLRIFTAVGLIVLLIALFNFINLATARAIQRAKEVGIRKAIGALRKQLVIQFLAEALLMTLLAVGLALVLLPAFLSLLNGIANKSLIIPFNKLYFVLSLVGVTLMVSLLAGIYPAIYLSKFKPIKVLKGIFNIHSGRFFRRSLVVGQFTLSVTLIIGAMVVYKQLTFLQDKDLGFDKSQLIHIRMKNDLRKNAPLMKAELEKQTSITGVTISSANLIDITNSTSDLSWEGKPADDKFVMTQINVDPQFLSVTGMQLLTGRNFDSNILTDSASAYMVNETAAKRMGWTAEEAIGKTMALWQRKGNIIGVVKDFHFRPLTAAIEPFMFHYWPKEPSTFLLIKTKPGHAREAISVIEQVYKKYEPQTSPQYEFVDQGLNNQYRTEQQTGRIVLYFSILAIVVSCLGLFGLATFTAEQRIKEIGVRKVLGATVTNITALLSKDFLKLVLIAIVIASPVAWYAMNWWLQDFSYKVNIEWWVFAVAGIAALLIALFTVSFQAIKAAIANPAKSLRTE